MEERTRVVSAVNTMAKAGRNDNEKGEIKYKNNTPES